MIAVLLEKCNFVSKMCSHSHHTDMVYRLLKRWGAIRLLHKCYVHLIYILCQVQKCSVNTAWSQIIDSSQE